MKKHDIKVLFIMILVLTLVWGTVTVFFVSSSDKIQYYLDEYDIENVSVLDVAEVNLGIKKCVKIGQTDKSDIVLSRTLLFEPEIMFGYRYTDRLGNMSVYKDLYGNAFSVVASDDWCPYFRVYYVSKGVI